MIWVVLGDFMGEDGDLYEIGGLESIELVELDLESVLESSGKVHRRIGPSFSVIFG